MIPRPEDIDFGRTMLPLVSRTFAPGIDVLPGPLADPVRLAYLLCRVADTIEDAPVILPRRRHQWLIRFAGLLSDRDDPGEALADEIAMAIEGDSPEIRLVAGLPRLIRLLRAAETPCAGPIIAWTRELSLGMARFVLLEEESREWTVLGSLEDLEAYEYYVAGTVGCLLHELIAIHLGLEGAGERQRRLAISFGLGLQGTNIIQDLADDRARGWSYVPEEVARRHGTTTRRLADPSARIAAMAAVVEMVERAMRNLDDGLEFVLLLPRKAPRIRLFCLWPLLLALRTLVRIVSSDAVLERRVRIAREEVRTLTREALGACLSNTAIRRLYERERLLVTSAIQSNIV
jgi:farnesyl-diphosphate farnesyltransferase